VLKGARQLGLNDWLEWRTCVGTFTRVFTVRLMTFSELWEADEFSAAMDTLCFFPVNS